VVTVEEVLAQQVLLQDQVEEIILVETVVLERM
jgi:hypothetical protein